MKAFGWFSWGFVLGATVGTGAVIWFMREISKLH